MNHLDLKGDNPSPAISTGATKSVRSIQITKTTSLEHFQQQEQQKLTEYVINAVNNTTIKTFAYMCCNATKSFSNI